MMDRNTVDDNDDKRLIYGTAWKGDQTADLVYQALKSGFRAIATAAQPKHYREDLVGEGIRRAIGDGIVTRQDLFIQTTFTPYPSQDPGNLPYDPHASLEEQVRASLANSLATLATVPPLPSPVEPYLDALVLHIPYLDPAHTRRVWAAMSRAVKAGQVRQLGVSNTSLADLELLVGRCDEDADGQLVRPTIVQNRFYPGDEGDFDRAVREYCCCHRHHRHHHHSSASSPVVGGGGGGGGDGGGMPAPITYQAFGLLRNRALVQDQASVGAVARILGVSPQVALYALVMETLPSSSWDNNNNNNNNNNREEERRGDIRILDGTTKEERMREDVHAVARAVAALRRATTTKEEEELGTTGDDDVGAGGDDAAGCCSELRRAMASFRMGFGE